MALKTLTISKEAMGNSLGTQCVRCYECNGCEEVDVASYITGDAALLGEFQKCSKCDNYAVGLSYYEGGTKLGTLPNAISRIRSYKSYNGPIACVHPWPVEKKGHWVSE
jgi:hypothetical protein